MTPNIHAIIRQHVSLEVRCIDRVYLHAYMPKLQTSGGLCYFLHDHLGYPVPSPALLKPRHDRFVAAVQEFAATQRLEIVPFERGESKDERVAKDRTRSGRPRSRFSRMTASKKCRPCTGRSKTWVRLTSSWQIARRWS